MEGDRERKRKRKRERGREGVRQPAAGHDEARFGVSKALSNMILSSSPCSFLS